MKFTEYRSNQLVAREEQEGESDLGVRKKAIACVQLHPCAAALPLRERE